MRRGSTLGLALALAVLPALVGQEPRAQSRGAPEARPPAREALARQVADELAAIDRTLSQVGAKLDEADAARGRRLAAASRLLRTPLGRPAGAPGAGMAAARRRAAARLLLERDLAERALLADEAARLRRATGERRVAAARLPELELPAELGRPASGKIVRRFGTSPTSARRRRCRGAGSTSRSRRKRSRSRPPTASCATPVRSAASTPA